MLQNHPFKVQQEPTDFNVIGDKKFIDTVSDYTLHLTFKKLPLVTVTVMQYQRISTMI